MFYLNEVYGFTAYIIVTILTATLLFKLLRRKSNTPPGPMGFPIVGHLPLLGKHPAKTLMTMGKKYGDVFSIRMGSWPVVVLNSRDAIREALVDFSDVFLDRPQFFSFRTIGDMRSVTFGSYNEIWSVKHKIAVKVLKQFATIKNNPTIEEIINDETEFMLTKFLKLNGEKFDPHDEIIMAVGSVIYQLSFGKDKNCRKDENFVNMVQTDKEFVKMTGAGNPIDVLPWLAYIMPWKVSNFIRIMRRQTNVVDIGIQERLDVFDQNNMSNISDGLISAAKKHDTDPNSSDVTRKEIYQILREILGAGFESVSTTLNWAVLYLSDNQSIQKKVQTEIDEVIGTRRPTIIDQQSLPYLKATILEIHRMCAVVPLNIPYATKKDTYFRKMYIKKGTVVLCNNYATAMDPNKWENPDKFLPERFLDENNSIIRSKAEEALTFGIGRRRCIGEALAHDELFLFLVNIYQRCKTELCSKPDFEGISGLTYKPKLYQIKVTPRFI